jgi:hypothetical protein
MEMTWNHRDPESRKEMALEGTLSHDFNFSISWNFQNLNSAENKIFSPSLADGKIRPERATAGHVQNAGGPSHG